MLERIHSLPYPWVFLFFWCLAMMRSHTMYWIGRGITAGTARSRWVSLLESPVSPAPRRGRRAGACWQCRCPS